MCASFFFADFFVQKVIFFYFFVRNCIFTNFKNRGDAHGTGNGLSESELSALEQANLSKNFLH